MQTQRTTIKNFFYFEISKIKNLKSAPLRDNTAKPAKKKNKQKKFKRRQKCTKKSKKL